jgi:hypothetical protein
VFVHIVLTFFALAYLFSGLVCYLLVGAALTNEIVHPGPTRSAGQIGVRILIGLAWVSAWPAILLFTMVSARFWVNFTRIWAWSLR